MEDAITDPLLKTAKRHAKFQIIGRRKSSESETKLGIRRPSELAILKAKRILSMTSATTLKAVRQIHNVTGLFFAPTVLFFAVTGGLQMFGLHETSRGSSYVPPVILEHLSQLHKKGTLTLYSRRQGATPGESAGAPKSDKPKRDVSKLPQTPPAPAPRNALPMKIFFAAAALALVISTCTGIIMGWRYARRKSPVLLVLAAGLLVPIVLLVL